MAAHPTSWLVRLLAVVGVLSLVGLVAASVWLVLTVDKKEAAAGRGNAALDAFYTPPATVPDQPGAVLRSEPLEYAVDGGKGYRFIYTSQLPSGATVPVSGMVFVPDAPPPVGGRKVLAFAHGTVGTAAECAPSRAVEASVDGYTPWLAPALAQGWVVVATDYVGLGIPADSSYLVGAQEARDVVNSVRAARAFPGAEAGSEWIVWGSSQGGNSALWAADGAAQLAPELQLRAVMAAVPAAELGATVSQQWDKTAVWALGPAVLASWVPAYPDRDFTAIVTDRARKQLDGLDGKCILGDALQGLLNNSLGVQFFSSNPIDDPAWAATIREQTPPAPSADLPLFVAQGTADEVVLAGSNATLVQQWCRVRPMTTLWLGGVSHQDSQAAAGPSAISWAAARFAGQPATNTCDDGVPPPVQPIPNPLPGG